MVVALSRPKIGRRSEITKPRSDQKKVWTKWWKYPTKGRKPRIGRKTNEWSHLSKCDLRLDPVEKRTQDNGFRTVCWRGTKWTDRRALWMLAEAMGAISGSWKAESRSSRAR